MNQTRVIKSIYNHSDLVLVTSYANYHIKDYTTFQLWDTKSSINYLTHHSHSSFIRIYSTILLIFITLKYNVLQKRVIVDNLNLYNSVQTDGITKPNYI